jgi:hypothetical protein
VIAKTRNFNSNRGARLKNRDSCRDFHFFRVDFHFNQLGGKLSHAKSTQSTAWKKKRGGGEKTLHFEEREKKKERRKRNSSELLLFVCCSCSVFLGFVLLLVGWTN